MSDQLTTQTFPSHPTITSQLPRRIGISFRKSYARRVESGFIARYLSKPDIIDIGFRRGDPDAVPITETAIGIEFGYPGYDGTHLPFPDESQDTFLRHMCWSTSRITEMSWPSGIACCELAAIW